MYPRALSTHNLCIRPFTYIESKNVIPGLISNLGLNKLGYNVFEDEVKEWANRVFIDYSYSDEVRRVMCLADRATNDVIGLVSFEKTLFIALLKEYRGRGYAGETLSSVYEYMQRHLNIIGINVMVPTDDVISQHLFVKYCHATEIERKHSYIAYKV